MAFALMKSSTNGAAARLAVSERENLYLVIAASLGAGPWKPMKPSSAARPASRSGEAACHWGYPLGPGAAARGPGFRPG